MADDEMCPACGGPMPARRARGRRRVWCSEPCRRFAAGRTPAEVRELVTGWRDFVESANAEMSGTS